MPKNGEFLKRIGAQAVSESPDLRRPNNLLWVGRVVVVSLLAGMAAGHRVWIGPRGIPLFPVWGGVRDVPGIGGPVLVGASALLLVTGLWSKGSFDARRIAAGLGLLLVVLAVDQLRWQPWVFEYVLILGGLAVGAGRAIPAGDGERRVQDLWRIVFASLYFWSGVHKCHYRFVHHAYVFLVEPLFGSLPEPLYGLVLKIGYLVPVVEAGLGVGLLVPRFRRLVVLGILGMHAFILACLMARGWNYAVWPWNIGNALCVYLLFRDESRVAWGKVVRWWYGGFVAFLVGVMPLFSFWGLWDSYLSWALYSGDLKVAYAHVRPGSADRIPHFVRRHFKLYEEQDWFQLDVTTWSIAEVGVPFYPQDRVYLALGEWLGSFLDEEGKGIMVLRGRPDWLTGERGRAEYDLWSLHR